MKEGTKVLIRTASAGVHFGVLAEKTGQEIRLTKARRLWSWNGALSLSEVSATGVDIKNSKISEQVEEIILLQAIEIIPISGKSNIGALCN